MKILFDLGHPAHFHLFHNVIVELKHGGHDIHVIAREKDCLTELLDNTGWIYHKVTKRHHGLVGSAFQTADTIRLALSLDARETFDLMVGTSVAVGPAARLSHSRSLVFNEDDAIVVPLFARLAYPLAHYIVTPNCLIHENLGKKHLTYPGFQELAYLHPRRFTPDPSIRERLGVRQKLPFFLVRLVSLRAHHDIGERGINSNQARLLIKKLQKHGKVFITAEAEVDEDLHPLLLTTKANEIFDVMAEAHMVIGDSQTMAAEAAVLGTPSLRCNTFAGRLSYLEELEHKYGLTIGRLPSQFDDIIEIVDDWLAQPDIKNLWAARKQKLLGDCVDVTCWIVNALERISNN